VEIRPLEAGPFDDVRSDDGVPGPYAPQAQPRIAVILGGLSQYEATPGFRWSGPTGGCLSAGIPGSLSAPHTAGDSCVLDTRGPGRPGRGLTS